MRQVESQMVNAVAAGRNWHGTNTSVDVTDHGIVIRLHGNKIAQLSKDDQCLYVTDAGWQTKTTKSRLNALMSGLCPGCGIYQKDFYWYLTRHGKDQQMDEREVYSIPL